MAAEICKHLLCILIHMPSIKYKLNIYILLFLQLLWLYFIVRHISLSNKITKNGNKRKDNASSLGDLQLHPIAVGTLPGAGCVHLIQDGVVNESNHCLQK